MIILKSFGSIVFAPTRFNRAVQRAKKLRYRNTKWLEPDIRINLLVRSTPECTIVFRAWILTRL